MKYVPDTIGVGAPLPYILEFLGCLLELGDHLFRE